MLCRHSRLYVPPESDFIPHFFGRKPLQQLDERTISDLLDMIFNKYRFPGEWQGPQPELQNFIVSMQDRTPAGFLNALYGTYAQQNGAERWGDKTPIYASYIKLLHIIFPDARFIHIIRDPFDAVHSMLEKYERDEFHVDIFFAARNWVRRIRKAREAGANFGRNHYYEIRYENLVENPSDELRKVCEFLQESYEPEMLSPEVMAQARIEPDDHFFSNVRNPVTTQSVGRGRKELSSNDCRVVEKVAGDLMEELGYAKLNAGKMAITEQLHLIFLAGKYGVLQLGRRVLQAMGFYPPI